MTTEQKKPAFEVVLLGIIFDPSTRKILIGRREHDPVKKLTWCFPGGRLGYNESLDKVLKQKIKNKTGYEVKNLGAVFVNTWPEKENLLVTYYLCEVFSGEPIPGDDIAELKWVDPDKVEKYLKTSFNKRLKEYILSLG